MSKRLLEKGIEALGFKYDETTVHRFDEYREILVERNKVMNLTSIVEKEEVEIKHFLDSIACITDEIEDSNIKIIDVGTGAGFPGLPIKILYNNISLTLLDSLNKRINFLQEVVEKLELENVTCIHGRAEDFGKDSNHREHYDITVSRAVADLSILAEYCLPFVKIGGYFISQKSKKVNEEVESADKALEVLGGKVEKIIPIKVPNLDAERYLVVIKKIKETPEKYPRRSGMPQKKPIA